MSEQKKKWMGHPPRLTEDQARAVLAYRRARKVLRSTLQSTRDAARELGINHSTLGRYIHGNKWPKRYAHLLNEPGGGVGDVLETQ